MIDIINLIGTELKKICPDVTIYKENQREGFVEPSFFVQSINSVLKPELFDRQNRNNGYQVVYFPDEDCPNFDIEKMRDTLMSRFNSLGNWSYVRNRSFNIVDGTLVMMFDIKYRAYQDINEPKQKTMDYHGGIK